MDYNELNYNWYELDCIIEVPCDDICCELVLYKENYPSIHFLPLNPSVGSRGGWSLSQRSSGDRWGTPWTGRQSITGPHRDKRDKQPCMHTFTPKDNLESSIKLTCMFLDGGRKPEYPERTHAYTGRTC